jgi:CxxC motif-containing protein (DUF1111 family)
LSQGTAFEPAKLHPGFGSALTVVLHRFGVNPDYRAWRLGLLDLDWKTIAKILGKRDSEILLLQSVVTSRSFVSPNEKYHLASGLSLSYRSPPQLWGAGLIDSIPEVSILELEKQKFRDFPEVHGRASRLKDGRIGRFGWKAVIPSLREAVLMDCAIELGLKAPGQRQPPSALDASKLERGFDLTAEECAALVEYVKRLSPSAASGPAAHERSAAAADGGALFASAGCVACHRPTVGQAVGIYSDLLLHDMGPGLASTGGCFSAADQPEPSAIRDAMFGWRTAPLWGFRDSGPYLHDGRADNLEEAVAFHAGESLPSARRFFGLGLEERLKIQMFLRSLAVSPALSGGQGGKGAKDTHSDLPGGRIGKIGK